MSNFLSRLAGALVGYGEFPEIPQWLGITLPILMILIGIAEGLFGAKIYKLQIYLSGFVCGATVGMTVLGFIGGLTELDISDTAVLIVTLLCGVIGLSLLIKLFRAGLFISAGIIAFYIVYSFTSGNIVPSAIAFVIGGVAGLFLAKPVMVIATSLVGGFMTVFSVMNLFSYSNVWVYLIASLVLAAGFAAFQFKRKHSDGD